MNYIHIYLYICLSIDYLTMYLSSIYVSSYVIIG